MEFGCHLRIQGDHHLSLLCHKDVPFLDLFSHPISEWLTDNGGAYIDNPLLRRLGQVDIIRQVVGDVWYVADELQDFLDREVLILGHVQVLDALVLQVTFMLVAYVLQEINRDVVCMKCIIRSWYV